MKYKILKALDVAGLTFLDPVVRLCYGEEPQKQLKEIGRYIVVPCLAIAAFIAFWFVVSDKIQTKSGQLPDPAETLDAFSSIWTFHVREGEKERAYTLTGKSREDLLAQAESRLAELEPLAVSAKEAVTAAEAERAAFVQESVTPLQERYDALKEKARAEKDERRATLVESDLAATDPAAYLAQQRADAAAEAASDETLSVLKAQIDEVWALRYPPLRAAQDRLTKIAEEKQYLVKLEELLSESSRELKTAEMAQLVDGYRLELESADGRTAFTLGSRILRAEDRLVSLENSTYAKPWTLPMQIARSVFCVFTGFLIGSAIAIPLGILCGLSRVFMAAMTPFIAIFKPVSPIVWLPIALIIVGGFIPDPDQHWFIQGLWNAPLIGWMKINPAFIASAITVALCSLWATLVNTALGVASIEKDHLNVARVLKLGFWSRLWKIVIPSALPLIFAGLRISLGVGWMVLIAAELLSSSEGIGKFVWDQFNNGASDSFAKMVVVVFVVGLIGLILDRIMIIFQRLVSFDGAPTAL